MGDFPKLSVAILDQDFVQMRSAVIEAYTCAGGKREAVESLFEHTRSIDFVGARSTEVVYKYGMVLTKKNSFLPEYQFFVFDENVLFDTPEHEFSSPEIFENRFRQLIKQELVSKVRYKRSGFSIYLGELWYLYFYMKVKSAYPKFGTSKSDVPDFRSCLDLLHEKFGSGQAIASDDLDLGELDELVMKNFNLEELFKESAVEPERVFRTKQRLIDRLLKGKQ